MRDFRRTRCLAAVTALGAVFAGCAHEPTAPSVVSPSVSPSQARSWIDRAIPPATPDRIGWATDIYASFNVLSIQTTPENICAVAAVIAQESSFRVDPAVPGLAAIAWREIDSRAARADVPIALVHTLLELKSINGSSYRDRIDRARTEKDLSDVYEDFIGAVPLGRTLFADHNPIRTRGPMQVNVAFAQTFAAANPYPYPIKRSIADELFTRRGGIYFGVAHLLDYSAPYDTDIYRFADFNAGQYSSRNAAFQLAVTLVSGIPLVADGALLTRGGESQATSSTELAVRALGSRLHLSDSAIHSALEQERVKAFEATLLYQRIFALADESAGHRVTRASLPQINLQGPKISRKLTTEWYAHRVDDRYRACVNRLT